MFFVEGRQPRIEILLHKYNSENDAKKQDNQERINLDKMKIMMNQSTDTQKLQQNEQLAKLRANTSLEKTILAAQLKKDSERYKK